MITEDYVSLETAKLLKEKGFDIPCNTYFVEVEKETAKNKIKRKFCHSSVVANRNAYKSEMANHYYFSCPTLQMVMKWLREVHKICISVDVKIGGGKYYVCISSTESGLSHGVLEDEVWNTFEEACESAIKYCLENLI